MKARFLILSALSFLMSNVAFPPEAQAVEGFYRYVDENGVIHLTNVHSDPRFKPLFKKKRRPELKIRVNKSRIYQIIETISRRYSVDPHLIKAIIKAESDFDPYAVSPAGAEGLMQLMPQTARTLNVSNPFDPAQSIDGGVRHLKRLLELFEYDMSLAIAAYNAGRSNVLKYGGIPPFKQTQEYVKKVLGYYNDYRKL